MHPDPVITFFDFRMDNTMNDAEHVLKKNIELKQNSRLFLKKAVTRLIRISFVKKAIAEKADLSAFKRRPGIRETAGVIALGVSYVIGWPMIALLGGLSIFFKRPAIVLVGGPMIYIISHLVFLLGMYLAGARYSWIFLRWLTRIAMLRLMKAAGTSLPGHPPDP
jgi:hypothetical protein